MALVMARVSGRRKEKVVPGPVVAAPAPLPPTVPAVLQHAIGDIEDKVRNAGAEARRTLVQLQGRLKRARDALDTDDPGHFRTEREYARKMDTVERALGQLNEAHVAAKLHAETAEYIVRYKDLELQARERKRRTDDKIKQSEARFLPMAPMEASAHGASPKNNATLISQELLYRHGMEQRPVELVPFDICPKCKVAMQHNDRLQQLVCPIPSCGYWKRFADMTSAALAFGEEIEFCKYSYKPVTHLEDTMKYAEAGEAFVVPPDRLEHVMRALYVKRVRPEDVTIPMIRAIVIALKTSKTENTVQIYSRLTGRAPRRFASYEKDKFRIMFQMVEKCYKKHCGVRVNKLSYPYTLYKYCELLGFWEMLETLPLLRGITNLGCHDVIQAKIHKEFDWEFIPTVKETY